MGSIDLEKETGVAKNDTPERREPNWDDMRLFGIVARAGSFRLAAKWLGTQAPTIIKRIASLESSFGLKLLDRTRNGISLTPPGHRAAAGANTMGAAMTETISRLRGARDTDPEVKILLSEGPANRWLIPYFLRKFRLQHPNVTLRISTQPDNAETMVPPYDLHLQYAISNKGDLNTVRIGTFHMMFFGTEEYIKAFGEPQSVEEFEHLRYADFTPSLHWGKGFWAQTSGLNVRGTPALISNSGNVIASAVEAGDVIGLIPTYLYVVSPSDLRPVLPTIHYENKLFLNFSPSAAERKEVRLFMDFLKEQVFDKHLPWFSDEFEMPHAGWHEIFRNVHS